MSESIELIEKIYTTVLTDNLSDLTKLLKAMRTIHRF
jgi:hypothetical protein